MEGRVVLRRGVTLADQLAAVSPPAPAASCNLRDLLKLRDDDHLAAAAGVTLNSAMAAEKRASSSSSSGGRTLLDIIRDEQPSSSAGGVPVVPRAVSSPVPDATAASASASTAGGPAGETSQRGQRVSLMALLERTERRWCGDGGGERGREEDAASEACDEEAGKKGVGGRCCVCMARAKGAAFIPCGHTFCRACARELSAGRGRCPLCNAAIHQVLDIF